MERGPGEEKQLSTDIEKIKVRLEEEIEKNRKLTEDMQLLFKMYIKALLQREFCDDREWEILERLFRENMQEEKLYRLILTNPTEKEIRYPHEFFLDHVQGKCYFVKESELHEWENDELHDISMGISEPHCIVKELSQAFEEALSARKGALLYEEQRVWFHDFKEEALQMSEFKINLKDWTQTVSEEKINDLVRRFHQVCFDARKKNISPVYLIDKAAGFSEEMTNTYQKLFEENGEEGVFPLPLQYSTVSEFIDEMHGKLNRCQRLVAARSGELRRNAKMNQAVRFIKENYQRELNLAIVSNHVSMNYSVFSNAFKQYSGMNFVDYLRDIRMQEAKRLLEETDEKIAEIGMKVGYHNDKHFMKSFKTLYGISPSSYRRSREMLQKNGK